MKLILFNNLLLISLSTTLLLSSFTPILTINNFSFEVDHSDKFCLHEYFSDKTLVIYEVTPYLKENNSIIIRDPNNKKLYSKNNVVYFKESFTTFHGGYYEICFFNNHNTEKQKFDFNLKSGIAAKDYSQVPKMKDLKPIEINIQKLVDKSDEYWRLVNYVNTHDNKYEALQENVVSTVSYFSMILIFLLVLIGGIEAVLAKRIIAWKKIR